MRIVLALFGFGWVLLLCSGCSQIGPRKTIFQVNFSTESGSILPELWMREEYKIQTDGVRFIRTGLAEESQVNSGEWVLQTDPEAIERLFSVLESVKLDEIIREESSDAPDGGGSYKVTLVYEKGNPFSLYYFGGATYANGEEIVEPVQAFLSSLDLPAEAAAQIIE